MRRSFWIGAVTAILGVVGFGTPAYAAISATATIQSQQVDPNTWSYSMSLKNTGDTPISTYWFGWIPAYDFLPSSPTPTTPAGWSVTEPQDGIFQPYWSIQWQSTTNGGLTSTPLQPGQTLSGFNFTSPDAPSVIGGSSYLGSFYPVSTSYVYSGLGEVGTFGVLNPTVATPEPVSLGLLGAPLLLMLRRRRTMRTN
jgi:hypothetical protein